MPLPAAGGVHDDIGDSAFVQNMVHADVTDSGFGIDVLRHVKHRQRILQFLRQRVIRPGDGERHAFEIGQRVEMIGVHRGDHNARRGLGTGVVHSIFKPF